MYVCILMYVPVCTYVYVCNYVAITVHLGGIMPYRVYEDTGVAQVLLVLSKPSSFIETAEVVIDNFGATGIVIVTV